MVAPLIFTMFFDYHTTNITYILLGITALCFVMVVFLYVMPLWRLAKSAATDYPAEETEPDRGETGGDEFELPQSFAIDNDADDLPRASVVVYTHTNTENLALLLPQLLAQRYAPGYEVIIVNDGESADTEDLVKLHSAKHRNLRLTFAPDDIRNISRKKLALMLGIKAAHNPVVVLTTSDADIRDTRWLATMMQPFAEGASVVLGYSQPTHIINKGFKRTLTFDHVADAAAWLSSALSGNPYRGTEYNLAYTRDLFFANKGFSRSLNLRHGDDDIFVSEIADGSNTSVVLDKRSRVGVRSTDPSAWHKTLRQSHRYTEGRVPHGRRFRFAMGILVAAVGIGTGAAAGVAGLPNLVPAIVAGVLVLGLLTVITLAWRKLIGAMTGRKMLWTIPALAFTYPLRRGLLSVQNLRHRRQRHFVWK